MNRIVCVFLGAEIPTITGFLRVIGWNAAKLVYCNEYSICEDGTLYFEGERRLTLEELSLEVKAVDGLNHKAVIFDVPYYEV